MNANKILTARLAANLHRRSLGLSAKPTDGVAKGANSGTPAPSRWFSFFNPALVLLVFLVMPGPVWSVDNLVCQYPPQTGTYGASGCSGVTWPTTWTAVTAMNDVANDEAGASGPENDIVGNATYAAFYTARVGNYLFFRLRVNAPAAITAPLTSPFVNDSIWIYLQTTAPLSTGSANPQYGFAWDMQDSVNHGLEMQKWDSGLVGGVWSTISMADMDNSSGQRYAPDFNTQFGTPTRTLGSDGFIRTVDQQATDGNFGGTNPNPSPYYTAFVDFAISCNYLQDLYNYTNVTTPPSPPGIKVNLFCGQQWYIQAGTSNVSNDHGDLNADAAGVTGLTGAIPGTLFGPQSTYALINDFTAAVRANQVVVEWDTLAEVGTQGFELARQDADGEFQTLHDGLITGQSTAGEGGHYRFVDPTAVPGQPGTYRLTEIEINGGRRELGQYPVIPLAPPDTAQARQAAHPAAPLAPGQAAYTPRPPTPAEIERVQARQTEREVAANFGLRAQAAAPTPSAAAPANRAAIAVRETGLYQVSASALAPALGWPEGKVKGLIQAGQLRLTHQGADIAWQTTAKNEGLRFYGEASRSIYDPESIYIVGQGAGTRMASVKLAPTGEPGPTSHPSQLRLEDNRFAATQPVTDPEADYWFWGMFNSQKDCQDLAKSCRVQEFSLLVPAPAATGPATLTLQLRGNSSLAAIPDHQVSVTLNGTPIGTGTWDGYTDLRLALPLAASLLRDGANQVRVEAQVPAGAAYNYFYLDRFDLDYPRRNLASQDQLVLSGPPGQRLTASGFSSKALQVFDLGDPRRPKTVSGAQIQSGSGGYQVSLVPASATTPYLLVADSAVRVPTQVRPLEATGLAGTPAGVRYLVIAPRDFAEEASQPIQRLLSLRANQGLDGRFVPLQALYDEYGDGQKTPHAIRRFLAAAVTTWKIPPAYVLLAGKGTYDPQDYLGYGTDRLPVLMALTPEAGLIAADQRFVDFNDDGRGDLAIGRLPAATAAEFAGMVDKLIAAEDAGPSQDRQAILVADGPDVAGNHTASSEATADHLLDAGLRDPDIQRLYLERLPAATARAGLLAGLGRGTDLVNYYGHAGVTALDHGLLTASDAAQLPEPSRWPLMLGMTCLMNHFEFPQLLTLGEALLLNPRGGAAAVWSSGGYSYDATATILNEAFLTALLQQRVPRLGDAIQAALAAVPATPGTVSGPGVYNLLGDPAMSNFLQ